MSEYYQCTKCKEVFTIRNIWIDSGGGRCKICGCGNIDESNLSPTILDDKTFRAAKDRWKQNVKNLEWQERKKKVKEAVDILITFIDDCDTAINVMSDE